MTTEETVEYLKGRLARLELRVNALENPLTVEEYQLHWTPKKLFNPITITSKDAADDKSR